MKPSAMRAARRAAASLVPPSRSTTAASSAMRSGSCRGAISALTAMVIVEVHEA